MDKGAFIDKTLKTCFISTLDIYCNMEDEGLPMRLLNLFSWQDAKGENKLKKKNKVGMTPIVGEIRMMKP